MPLLIPTPPADWDGAWKEAVVNLLQAFLAFFFPQAYNDIDWSRGVELLAEELRKLAPDSASGRRTVDLLFKVWRRSGEEQWVLLHIEIQAQPELDFAERTFEYKYRIKDFNRRPVATFVILADDEPGWRPGPYKEELWGCRTEFHYPTVKILDWAERMEELEASRNPFAVVVLAHLRARETAGDAARRRVWKVRLLKGLYGQGWERKEIRELIKLIDWFLKLSREDDRIVREEIEADEKEKQVPYVTSFEQMAMEEGEARGEARGRAWGLKNGITLALRVKFGEEGRRLAMEIPASLDLETFGRLADAIESAASVDDVRRAWSA